MAKVLCKWKFSARLGKTWWRWRSGNHKQTSTLFCLGLGWDKQASIHTDHIHKYFTHQAYELHRGHVIVPVQICCPIVDLDTGENRIVGF